MDKYEPTRSSIREGFARSGDGVSGRPTKELVTELIREGQHLIREEIHLARAEIKQEAKDAVKPFGAMAAGGVIAHAALFVFAAFLTLLLAAIMPAALAAFLVFCLYAGAGAGLVFWGKKRAASLRVKPERTVKTLEEDRRWMKDTLQNVKSNARARA